MTEDAETQAAPGEDLQAPSKPKARERGRMRRRLRAQSRVRETLLLDLGATVWELHRHGRREPGLLQAKASHLAAVDDEVRGLTEALEGGHGVHALVQAGVSGVCTQCAALLTADSRYCPACGTAVVMNGTLEPAVEGPSQPEAPTEVTPLPAVPASLRRRVGRRLRGAPPP